MPKPDIGYYVAELRHMACNAGMDVDDKAHLEQAADELEKQIPFASRAEVETVLKEAGLKLEAQAFGSASYRTFDQSGEVLVYILHNGLITIERKEIVLRNFPLSLLTPALLDKILEAK